MELGRANFSIDLHFSKTSVLNDFKRFCQQEPIAVIPTFGQNVCKFKHKGVEMNIQDMGGDKNLRKHWTQRFRESDIIIYVVDSTDSQERLRESIDELRTIVNHKDTEGAAICVCANKMDEVNSQESYVRSAAELIEKFELNRLLEMRNHTVIETCSGSSVEDEYYKRKQQQRKTRFGALSDEELTRDDEEKSKFPLDLHYGVQPILSYLDKCIKNDKGVKQRSAHNKKKRR
jgi:small GTP-binding protein